MDNGILDTGYCNLKGPKPEHSRSVSSLSPVENTLKTFTKFFIAHEFSAPPHLPGNYFN